LKTDVAAQKELMERQKGVAPGVQAARKRAEDMAQASVTRREADRAKMEDEMKARSGRSFTENTELIGSMLGGLRGAKTLGDALAGAGAAAGATTTAQRKEQMEQQALMRIEANAIDALKQAQADKQVAIATGDTDKAQAADKAIAEASTALTQARQKMRSEIAKTKAEQESAAASTTSAQAAKQRAATEEREVPLDRASRQIIARAALKQAQANRDEMMGFNREKLAEQQYKNSTDYKSIQKELEGAKTMYRMSENPKTKLRLDKAIAADAALRAKFTGETPVAPPAAPLTPQETAALAKYGITK
jgi:actin-related protein